MENTNIEKNIHFHLGAQPGELLINLVLLRIVYQWVMGQQGVLGLQGILERQQILGQGRVLGC